MLDSDSVSIDSIPLCHAESVEVTGAIVREAQLSDSMTGSHVGATRDN